MNLRNDNSLSRDERSALAYFVVACLGCSMLWCGCSSPMAPGPTTPPTDDTDLAREIEEADIVKVQDGYFYLANPYTGLRIIDAREPDQPVMMGGVALGGRGVELFIREGRAYVFTTADFYWCAGSPVGFDELQDADSTAFNHADPDYTGSRLWIVDVSDPAAPELVNWLDFDGFMAATRRVGDVIYVAGNIAGNTAFDPLFPFGKTGVFVTSINIADPDEAVVVETEEFPGDSLDIHVSTESLYVFGDDPDVGETTLVTYVDISDPAGDIVGRSQFRVPGRITNRFFVDEYEDTFRIVTEELDFNTWVTTVSLYVYDVSNPDAVDRLAKLPIITGESLRAVRFDGPRGYAVTFLRVDPLFVLDLSDPAAPVVAGELEVPGYSTHIVPLGDRLVAVGFDDTAGFRPAVALYDVSDPANPTQSDRVIIGEQWSFDTTSEATVDEKALRVLADAGLILLPVSTFDFNVGGYVDSLQLIELSERNLNERGTIDHRGLVRRADLLDGRVWVLSDLAFQTVNIDDLDEPVSLAALDVIDEQELLDAGLSQCVASTRTFGTPLGGFWIPGDMPGVFSLLFQLCGAGVIPMAALTAAGMMAFTLIRRR